MSRNLLSRNSSARIPVLVPSSPPSSRALGSFMDRTWVFQTFASLLMQDGVSLQTAQRLQQAFSGSVTKLQLHFTSKFTETCGQILHVPVNGADGAPTPFFKSYARHCSPCMGESSIRGSPTFVGRPSTRRENHMHQGKEEPPFDDRRKQFNAVGFF